MSLLLLLLIFFFDFVVVVVINIVEVVLWPCLLLLIVLYLVVLNRFYPCPRGDSELTIPGGGETPALHIRAISRSFQVGL